MKEKQLTFSCAFFTINDELERLSLCQKNLFPRVEQRKTWETHEECPGEAGSANHRVPGEPLPVCHRYLL
jgi:hypothetical protein